MIYEGLSPTKAMERVPYIACGRTNLSTMLSSWKLANPQLSIERDKRIELEQKKKEGVKGSFVMNVSKSIVPSTSGLLTPPPPPILQISSNIWDPFSPWPPENHK
jgi:hypothetical protein